jgi:raffinose/stachyose/melibiose transport system permease protein
VIGFRRGRLLVGAGDSNAEGGDVVRKTPVAMAWTMALFLLPGLAVYAAFFLIPAVQGFLYSLYDWEGYRMGAFIGLENYRKMASDEVLKGSIVNILYFMVVYATLPVALGLACAEILSRGRVRGSLAIRIVYYLPQIFNLTAVGILFRWVLHPDYGILNTVVDWFGLGGLRRPWLGDPSTAIHAVAAMTVWFMFGYVMVIFFAGMQRIPASLYEAAMLDGAGPVRQFRSITLPSLRNEFTVILILMLINALNTYPMIAAATEGGPGYATMVPALYGFRVFSYQSNVGYGSAIIDTLVVATLVFSMGVYVLREREA